MITIKSCKQIWFSSNYKTYYLFLIQLSIGLQVITCLVENIMGEEATPEDFFFNFLLRNYFAYDTFIFISNRAESNEDLLSMSTVVYDQLPSLSTNSYKLCLCNNSKIYCSFKKFDECTTKTRGKEYHCILHSSSKNKREVRNQSGSVILQDDDNVLKVSLICTENQEKETD